MINNIKIISLKGDDPGQENITEELIKIDSECFNDTGISDWGTLDYWLKNRKASFVELLLHNKEIVGYCDFLVLNEAGLKKLKTGNWRDGEIDSSLLSNKEDHDLSIYLIAIAIRKKFRGLGLAKKLWNSARKRFIEDGYFIKDIYGIIWTADGDRLFKNFNPVVIGQDFAGHQIIQIKPLDGKMPEFKKIRLKNTP